MITQECRRLDILLHYEGLKQETDGLIKDFRDYSDRRKTSGFVSYADLEESWRQNGDLVKRLLAGCSKQELVEGTMVIDDSIDAKNNRFIVPTLYDLAVCLYDYTFDIGYAAEQAVHEREHALLFSQFNPKRRCEYPPDVNFSVFITSDGFIVPFAGTHRNIVGKTAQESIKIAPYKLLHEWSVDTHREWWRFLQAGVQDRSIGDSLILG